MSLSKKGKSFPSDFMDKYTLAGVVSLALRQAADNKELTIKKVVKWTGASEKTVKNWFSGHCAPTAEYMIVLMRHCDGVLTSVLRMADRSGLLVALDLDAVERKVVAIMHLIHEIKAEVSGL